MIKTTIETDSEGNCVVRKVATAENGGCMGVSVAKYRSRHPYKPIKPPKKRR